MPIPESHTMTAHAYETLPPHPLPAARVRLRDGDRYTVSLEGGGGEVVARRAASCLLAPEPGDRVLLTLSPEPFVLAVLERDRDRAARIDVQGDATLRATGALTIDGEAGIVVQTSKALSLVSRAFRLRSEKAEVASESLVAVAKQARGNFEEAGVVSRTIDAVAERITQKAARAYRMVSELDQLRARHFDYRADHSARIASENTVVTARQVVKVDGEQVHIG